MIEMASRILLEEKKAIHYKEVFEKIAELKGFTAKQKKEEISHFYTDMNVDGRFLTLGSGMWGLKRWYPVEQAEEQLTEVPKKKKKATKKKKLEVEETEELDIVDDEMAEVVPDDFDDELDDDFDEDFDDEDFDEDLEEEIDEESDEDKI